MQRKYHKTQQVYTKDNENYRASTFLLTYLVLFIPYGTKASVSSFLCIQSLAACCASPHDRFIFSNSSDTVLHHFERLPLSTCLFCPSNIHAVTETTTEPVHTCYPNTYQTDLSSVGFFKETIESADSMTGAGRALQNVGAMALKVEL